MSYFTTNNYLTFCNRKIVVEVSMKFSTCLAPVVLIGITLLLIGCQTPSKSAEDTLKSILASEADCTSPCWRSLRPGLSSKEDFLKLVNASSSRLFDDISHTELNPEGMEYAWDDREYNIFTRVRIHEDRIRLLGFRPRNNDISLSMITELYGQPSMYGASILGSHHDYYVKINFIYEKDSMVIEANFPIDLEEQQIVTTNCEFELDWNAIPDRLYFYLVEPGTAEEMVHKDPIGGFTNPSHQPQPWKGENPIKLTMCP